MGILMEPHLAIESMDEWIGIWRALPDGYALMPEYDYKPVNRYLPPRPRRDGCADTAAKAAPKETLDTAHLPGVLRWLDRVLSR